MTRTIPLKRSIVIPIAVAAAALLFVVSARVVASPKDEPRGYSANDSGLRDASTRLGFTVKLPGEFATAAKVMDASVSRAWPSPRGRASPCFITATGHRLATVRDGQPLRSCSRPPCSVTAPDHC